MELRTVQTTYAPVRYLVGGAGPDLAASPPTTRCWPSSRKAIASTPR